MADVVYLQGKSKYAKLKRPDDFGYSVQLYLTPESWTVFKSLGVMNHIKRDEDGDYVVLRRPTQKMIRGKVVAFEPPVVVDKDMKPLVDVLIGNGSDLTCKLDHYEYTSPTKKKGHAIRLVGVKVDNLVPYVSKRDMDKEDYKVVESLESIPAPSNPGW